MADYANASDLTSREEAKEQHPNVDEAAPAASETEGNVESDVVFAQTPEEVEAQVKNRAAGATDPDAGEAGLEGADGEAGDTDAVEDEAT